MKTYDGYRVPPHSGKDDGALRRVGFELEFSGIDLDAATQAVLDSIGGEIVDATEAECSIEHDELGTFGIEIDWSFLKRKARESAEGEDIEWVQPLSEAALLIVPVEVVCPPIPLNDLARLDPMISALREAGAQGTEESLAAAYGVHVNTEIPSVDAAVIQRYLRAFALLQWWLVDAHDVDSTRRLTPYIDPWPEAYLHSVLQEGAPQVTALMDEYLEHNPTRNRGLDMLPLFSSVDADRVQAVVNDPRVNARPAFHYRLPNCHIEHNEWQLSSSWNLWCVVESLAWDDAALEELGEEFRSSQRPIIGVSRGDWVERMWQWLRDRELV